MENTAIKVLEFIADYAGYVMFAIFGVIGVLVIIRGIIKVRRKEKIEITPVGIFNDLPESVTGMNKHEDQK